MRNPLAVFLFSIDHKSGTLNKIYAKIGLYLVIAPFPFEHYCMFCRRFSDLWWKSKAYFKKKAEQKVVEDVKERIPMAYLKIRWI